MSILELYVDQLYSILDNLNWKAILMFSSICTKFNTFHDRVLDMINNNELFRRDAQTELFGVYYRYLTESPSKYISWRTQTVFSTFSLSVRNDRYISHPYNAIYIIDEPDALNLWNYAKTGTIEQISYKEIGMRKYNKYAEKVRYIVSWDDERIKKLIIGSITFSSDLKILDLHKLLQSQSI